MKRKILVITMLTALIVLVTACSTVSESEIVENQATNTVDDEMVTEETDNNTPSDGSKYLVVYFTLPEPDAIIKEEALSISRNNVPEGKDKVEKWIAGLDIN